MNEAHGFEFSRSDAGVELLRLEAINSPGLENYVKDLGFRYVQSPLLQRLTDAAELVEPIDETPDEDQEPDFNVANAFLTGELLGLRIADHFLPDNMLATMSHFVPIEIDEVDDDLAEAVKQAADYILEEGDRAYVKEAVAYHELIEEWARELWSDVTLQPYVKRGFGFIFYLMDQVHTHDLKKMEAEIDNRPLSGLSWDSEIEDLLKNPPRG